MSEPLIFSQINEMNNNTSNFADQRYKNLDLTLSPLSIVQQYKIDQLNEACSNTILSGFTSSAIGVRHTYGFSYQDQNNMNQELTMIAVKPELNPIPWRTLDAGVLDHTQTQFIQVCSDARDFKYTTIQKYWNLVGQVKSATTNIQIDAIIW